MFNNIKLHFSIVRFIFKYNFFLYIELMVSRLVNIKFPENVESIYVNGKRYNRIEFKKAQHLEKRRKKNGRFAKGIRTTEIEFPKRLNKKL